MSRSERRALGYKIYIDGFGTGYPPLPYLAKLPMKWVKIDRFFIKRIPRDGVICTQWKLKRLNPS
ncbi:EAL domain-containing protein [uncultured Pseudoteredinibacter sp.]|uniref:EAL domain-containing protein n=1 Tax=uncultured Pseudoteredinibacter sp. TaxID=1641701 RepID=UPI003425A521